MKPLRILGICMSLLIATVPSNAVASEKDQALALATSGCYQGLFKPLMPTSSIAFNIINTAVFNQLGDDANNEYVQNHHNQLSEGWNSAATLDSRWSKLIATYENVYSYANQELQKGKRVFEVTSAAERKYGGTITSLCKIAISNSNAKAKVKKVSLKQWVVRNAGYLLPPLDPRG
jgi:hypothetical protein